MAFFEKFFGHGTGETLLGSALGTAIAQVQPGSQHIARSEWRPSHEYSAYTETPLYRLGLREVCIPVKTTTSIEGSTVTFKFDAWTVVIDPSDHMVDAYGRLELIRRAEGVGKHNVLIRGPKDSWLEGYTGGNLIRTGVECVFKCDTSDQAVRVMIRLRQMVAEFDELI